MLNLTRTTITSVGLAHYGVSRAKDWVSVDCGTNPSLWTHCSWFEGRLFCVYGFSRQYFSLYSLLPETARKKRDMTDESKIIQTHI